MPFRVIFKTALQYPQQFAALGLIQT